MNSSTLRKIALTLTIVVLSTVTIYCFWQFIKTAGTTSYPGISARELQELNAYAYKNLGVSMVSLITALILVIRNRD